MLLLLWIIALTLTVISFLFYFEIIDENEFQYQGRITDLQLEDKPLLEKTADGLSNVAGATVAATGYFVSNPFLMLFVVTALFIGYRSQAALEFIFNYGWVILIVLVSIGALAYFGVLNPDRFVPNKCTLPFGITCLDYNIETSKVVLVLKNNLGETLTLERVDIASTDTDTCSNKEPVVLKNNDKVIVTVLGCSNGNIGNRFSGDLNATYTKESQLSHLVHGSILGKIAGISKISSFNMCQNAENEGLCLGLDIVFGIGYKDACCSEHTLCCL